MESCVFQSLPRDFKIVSTLFRDVISKFSVLSDTFPDLIVISLQMQEVALHATRSWPNWRKSTMIRTILESTLSRSMISDLQSNMASRISRLSRTSARKNRLYTTVNLALILLFLLAQMSIVTFIITVTCNAWCVCYLQKEIKFVTRACFQVTWWTRKMYWISSRV